MLVASLQDVRRDRLAQGLSADQAGVHGELLLGLALLPGRSRGALLVIPSRAKLSVIAVAVNRQPALRARPHWIYRLLPPFRDTIV